MRRALVLLLTGTLLALPGFAVAHPEGEGGHDFEDFSGGSYGSSHGNADLASPNMFHTANRTNPQVTNSDLAFWQAGAVRGPHHDLLAAGNYNGFRLFDIKDPENPVLVSDFRCRGPQNDVSFHQAQDRLLLIQSIDRPQT
ncbi:MAG: hypothetical protein M3271_02265, partial [Actinomycetota bacterium]|nr:hypothetical protein [Actinomycetota bacterium]